MITHAGQVNTQSNGRACAAFLGAGLLAIGAYYGLAAAPGVPDAVASAVFAGFSGLTALVLAVVAVKMRSAARGPWLLLAAGQASYTVGDSLYWYTDFVLHTEPFPSLADAFYLAQYPLMVGALIGLVRRRTPGWQSATLIDAAIVATAAGLLWWVYVIQPLATAPDLSSLARGVVVAYPIGDLLVLAVAVRLMLGSGTRTPAYHLLVASLAAMLAADFVFAVQMAEGTYVGFSWLDSTWLVSYALLGATALHPSMRRLDERSAVAAPDATRARLALLGGASILAPVLLVVRHAQGAEDEVAVIGTACVVLFLLVLLRMAGLVAVQRKLAVTDGLTGLYTRGFVEEQLRVEAGRAERTKHAFGVIIVDADHFKLINDSYGHPVGDQVLCEMARRLRAACRPGDIVGRYGGEEFALLLPAAGPAEVATLGERIRASIAATPFEVSAELALPVTVSVGAASLPADSASAHGIVQVADRALYAAKRLGRNRVVTAADLQPAAPDTVHHGLIAAAVP
jgi:diguanylate cyclase (GGDEF)-like protein